MGDERGWRTGLQAYAYDVNDGGADPVVNAAALCGADTLFVAVSYLDHIATTEEGRAAALLHNPRRRRHGQEAYVRPSAHRYPADLVPPLSEDPGADGEAAYVALRAAAEPRDIGVVPWILALSQPAALASPAHAVVNVRGQTVPGWLCPSQPATTAFVLGLIEDVIDKLRPNAIFLDAIRFPGPGPHGLVDLFTCFCDACCASAEEQGLDLAGSRPTLLALADQLDEAPTTIARLAADAVSTGFAALTTVARHPAFLDWAEFRHRAIAQVVGEVARAVRGRAELWLDVWPPSYGWLLGQDLARLAPFGPWTKPFTYHRWGGGADIPRIIGALSGDPAVLQQLYDAYRVFFGFASPPRFEEFVERGLDPQWVTTETALARRLLAGRSRLAAGLQLWHMGPAGVREALEHALLADPDGVFFHCYGWATEEEFRAAGDWLRERGLARR